MSAQMSRRGPDGSGFWVNARADVVLVHRRLAIIDTSELGSQPMHLPESGLHIVFNGEIYNYRQLGHDLEARGVGFRSGSDTEVLLRLFELEGIRALSKLRGMYAFAVWDDRCRKLTLARDPFGIKPLYYRSESSSFWFASQVKAMLAARPPVAHSKAGQVGFYTLGYVPEPFTLYEGLVSLPAGHFLEVTSAGASAPRSFHDWPSEIERARVEAIGADEAQDAWAVGLRNAVSSHLVSDVPVGVFLSSGLDSSTLVSVAHDAGANVKALTLGFAEYEGTTEDEVPLAKALAGELGLSHAVGVCAANDFLTDVGNIFTAMDQPSIDGVNTYLVCALAAKHDLKVAISGLGGDELLGGYPGFAQVPRLVSGMRLLRRAPGVGRTVRQLSSGWMGRMTSSKYAGLVEYSGSICEAYLLRRALYMPWELDRLLEPAVVQDGWLELNLLQRMEDTLRDVDDDRLKITMLEWAWYMRGQLLRDADWAGMWHSVEVRVPFVDVPLTRTALRIAAGGSVLSKSMLARVPSKPLDVEHLSRRKTGFSTPVERWERDLMGGVKDRGLRAWARHVYAAAEPTGGGASSPAPDGIQGTRGSGDGSPSDTDGNVSAPGERAPRVALVYRARSRGGYSVEELFTSVARSLHPDVQVCEYRLTSKWGSLRDLLALYRLRADVYHITGDIHYVALLLPRSRTVVTVLDMNHCLYDLRGLRRRVFKFLWFDAPLARASAVTAISQVTKDQLLDNCRRLHTRPDIRVVGCCVPQDYKCEPRTFETLYPRVLFVGTAPWKNLARLAAALEGIPCRLVVIGQLDSSMRDQLERRGLDIENYTRASGEGVHAQYVQADLVAFVSLREGFGMPIIEAQAVGRPVVVSDTSPMREVAGAGACLVDPCDVAAIRRGLVRIISDQEFRDRVVEAGRVNVRRFAAERIASEYAQVYGDVIRRSRSGSER